MTGIALQQLGKRMAGLRAATRRWRAPLAVAGALVLIGGITVSLFALEIGRDEVTLGPAVLNALILVPIGLVLASINLKLLARTVDRDVGIATGITVAAVGRIAELLPLPGGAMVRGAALMRAGASLGDSSMLLVVTGLLTLAVAAAFSGAAMLLAGYAVAWLVLAGALIGMAVCCAWIFRRAGAVLMLLLLLLRFGMMILGAVRLMTSFAVINEPVSGIEAAIFIVCTTLFTAMTIIPSGLGVGEAAAAALAYYVEISPAAAFLAVALNSTIGLAICGIVAVSVVIRTKAAGPDDQTGDIEKQKVHR